MKRKQAESELNVIRKLHENHLKWGYIVDHNLPHDTNLVIEYRIEWRGKYGFIPGIYIWLTNKPQCSLSVIGAYKYIRMGLWKFADVTIPVQA